VQFSVLTPFFESSSAFGIIFLYLIVRQYTSNKAWTGDMMTNLESSSAESTLAQQAVNVSASVDTPGQCDSRSLSHNVWSATIQRAIISLFGGSGAVIEGMDELPTTRDV
jgi:hypothetical protein